MYRKTWQKGEIATIIALSTAAFIFASSLVGTLVTNKLQTISTYAYKCGGSARTCPCTCNNGCDPNNTTKCAKQPVNIVSTPVCTQGQNHPCSCTCINGCDAANPTKCAKAAAPTTTTNTCKQGKTQDCPCTCNNGCDPNNTTKCAKQPVNIVSTPVCTQGQNHPCSCTCINGCDAANPTKCAKAVVPTTTNTCKQGVTQACPCTCNNGCDPNNTTKCAKQPVNIVSTPVCTQGQNHPCSCTCINGCDAANPTKCAKAVVPTTTNTCKQGVTQACPCTCNNGCDEANPTECARNAISSCYPNYVWQGQVCWSLHVDSQPQSGSLIPIGSNWYCGNEIVDNSLCGAAPASLTCTSTGIEFSGGKCWSLNSKLVNSHCTNEVILDAECNVYEIGSGDQIVRVDCNNLIVEEGKTLCLVVGTTNVYLNPNDIWH